jgi:ribulose-phosphate 3-epimerase
MNATPLISPSIATGDLMRLAEEIKKLELAGADQIHVDCMDGHFVPFLTIGVPVLEQMRKITQLPLDVHIMVNNTDAVFEHYLAAGADTLTFQIETATHAHRICAKIREKGKRAGVALNPSTHWRDIEYLLPSLDQVTVMAVNPGFSRQAHIPSMARKVKEIAEFCTKAGLRVDIQVDGGVNTENARELFTSGARNLVAGGAVFNHEDYAQAIFSLRNAAAGK